MIDRLAQLQKLLAKEPDDVFLLYGIGLEYKKLGQFAPAREYLNRVISVDPLYCYAYHQLGLIHESTGDIDAAKKAYQAGMESARKKGDTHALGEIEAALSML